VEVAATTSGGPLITKVQSGGPGRQRRAPRRRAGDHGRRHRHPDPAALTDVLAGLRPGQTVRVEVARPGGPSQAVRVTLGQFPG
jgi:putative serine protease PepD